MFSVSEKVNIVSDLLENLIEVDTMLSFCFTDFAEMGSGEDGDDIFQVSYERTERTGSLQYGRQATKGRLHGKGWSFWG